MSLTFPYILIEEPPHPPVPYPLIPITLKGRVQVPFLALLDSGADMSAVSSSIATLLGLPLGKHTTIEGVGGAAEVAETTLALTLSHRNERYDLDVPATVVLGAQGEALPILLGRKGFFDAFHTTFKEKERFIVLEKA